MLRDKIINFGFFKVACFVVLAIRLPLSFVIYSNFHVKNT